MSNGHLNLWTVCRNPKDYPGKYTARRSEIRADGPRATAEVIVEDSLAGIRARMRAMGLVCLAREPSDEEVIVECWL